MRTKTNVLSRKPAIRSLGVVFGISVVVSLLQVVLGPARVEAWELSRSRLGRIWVVSANVKEHEASDVKDREDMRNVLKVTLGRVTYATPDVILLQQVDRSSAQWLKNAFSNATGDRFVVAGGPARTPRADKGATVRRDDSAILVNASTSRVLATGNTQVTQRPNLASRKPMTQIVPWAKVVEKGSPKERLKAIVSSIHYPKHSAFINRSASQLQKARWSVKLHRFLNHIMPTAGVGDGRLAVLGGDFNTQKCKVGTYDVDGTCKEMRFWNRLTRLGYKDPINIEMVDKDIRTRPIIDFLFSRANVVVPRFYSKFNREFEYFSDHGIGAGLLEDEDTTAPWGPSSGRWRYTDQGHPCLWGFAQGKSAWDGGSGAKEWLFYRRLEGDEDWTLIKRLPYRFDGYYHGGMGITTFIDFDQTQSTGDQLEYAIAVRDRAGNVSSMVRMGQDGGNHCRIE